MCGGIMCGGGICPIMCGGGAIPPAGGSMCGGKGGGKPPGPGKAMVNEAVDESDKEPRGSRATAPTFQSTRARGSLRTKKHTQLRMNKAFDREMRKPWSHTKLMTGVGD
jgi:hypothetical protein